MALPTAKLVIKNGELSGQEFLLSPEGVTMGRASTNSIQIKSPKASKEHASVYTNGDLYYVKDLGSSNGTFVDNVQITDKILEHNDTILVGDIEISFLLLDAPPDQKANAAPAILSQKQVPSAPGAQVPVNQQGGFSLNELGSQQPQPAPQQQADQPQNAYRQMSQEDDLEAASRSFMQQKLIGFAILITVLLGSCFVGYLIIDYYRGEPEIPRISFHVIPYTYDDKGEPVEVPNFIHLSWIKNYEYADGIKKNTRFMAVRFDNPGSALTIENKPMYPEEFRPIIKSITLIKPLANNPKDIENGVSDVAMVILNKDRFVDKDKYPRKITIPYLGVDGMKELILHIQIPTINQKRKKLSSQQEAESIVKNNMTKALSYFKDEKFYMATKYYLKAYLLGKANSFSTKNLNELKAELRKAQRKLETQKITLRDDFVIAYSNARKSVQDQENMDRMLALDKWLKVKAILEEFRRLIPDSFDPARQEVEIFSNEINNKIDFLESQNRGSGGLLGGAN